MKKVLIVQGHKEVEPITNRHADFWVNPGWTLVGFSPNDGTIWPKQFEWSVAAGKSCHASPDMVKRLAVYLQVIAMWKADLVMMIEYDTLIFGSLPYYQPEFHSALSQSENPIFSCDLYCSVPWVLTPSIAGVFAGKAESLIAEGRIEYGSTDRFLALIAQECGVKPVQILSAITRCNGSWGDDLERVGKQIKEGQINFVHSIKSEEQLRALLA